MSGLLLGRKNSDGTPMVERGHFSHSTPIESNSELFSNSWNEFNFFWVRRGKLCCFPFIYLPLNAYVLHGRHLRVGHSPYRRPPPPPRHRTYSRGRRGAPRPTCAPGSCGSTPRRRDTTCALADLALFEWLFSGWRRKASLVKIEKYDFTALPFN